MFDVASFLLRWMFLSNLCRDVADIQTLPSQPYYYHPTTTTTTTTAAASTTTTHDQEAAWKEQCLRGILSYPPGTQRTLVMDALRVELVQQLENRLRHDQDCLKRYNAYKQQQQQQPIQQRRSDSLNEKDNEGITRPHYDDGNDDSDPYLDADLEIVHEFERAASGGASSSSDEDNNDEKENDDTNKIRSGSEQQQISSFPKRRASLIIGEDGDTTTQELDDDTTQEEESREQHSARRIPRHEHSQRQEQQDRIISPPPSLQQVREASQSQQLVRKYLPQLVSAVLRSPPAFHQELANPIQKLQSLILSNCALNDPSVGIELCWLLEAEVGRAWQTLFEHRRSAGKRLIVVIPAEKAAVIAQIGIEKRHAFDLLQDAEQATAYGYYEDDTTSSSHHSHYHHQQQQQAYLCDQQTAAQQAEHSQQYQRDDFYQPYHHHHTPTRLPSSLSLRRCSHFGDTMHFIDRLTQISSHLRTIASQEQRYDVLHDRLYELNRRLRRRMVTRGDVSLDVEDHRSAHDWPQITDMSADMIQYSVHLPLQPETGTWPNGEVDPLVHSKTKTSTDESDLPNNKVVRVLNIVVPESKILASRERCPFLVHLEVADTGLDGSDPRLYTAGANDLVGSTVGEALSMSNVVASTAAAATQRRPWGVSPGISRGDEELPPFGIPPELLHQAHQHDNQQRQRHSLSDSRVLTEQRNGETEDSTGFPRGGWQADGQYNDQYYDDHNGNGGYVSSDDPFGLVRQQEFEQLHHQLYHTQQTQAAPTPHPPPTAAITAPKVSVGTELLDKVFGRAWTEKCQEIRDASPYGHIKGWRLASFIMKAGEDIRREAFVMQIISKLQAWFQKEIPAINRPFMRPYTIMCVGGDAGLLQCLSDAKSIDEVKKRTDGFTSLRDYFERAYGPPGLSSHHHHHRPYQYHHLPLPNHGRGGPTQRVSQSGETNRGAVSFETAQDNFLRSLVGYSLVCYILQIKDRHNANILIDRVGHIMHIDFGFVLGDTPKMAKVPIFTERAPFKLSAEFWEVLGGWDFNGGGLGVKFCKMFELAFACASAHADEIATLTEATMLSLDSNPRTARATANGVRNRLRMRGAPGSREQKMFVMGVVNAALANFSTSAYDWLQRNMNGYQ